jgi:hypothetical protein
MLRQRLVIMGVLLSTVDFDRILDDARPPAEVPLSLRESSAFCPQIEAARRTGMMAALGGGVVAAPVAFSIKTSVAALFLVFSGTVAGAATYCVFKAPEPKPAVAARTPAPAQEIEFPTPSGARVPEPSGLSVLGPAALLFLRRTRGQQ